MAALAAIIAIASYRYLLPGAPGRAPEIFANRFTHLGVLTVHASFAATALLVGPWQFVQRLRVARPRLHRRLGAFYVVCCLCAGAAGLVLAFGTTAGPVGSAGFGLLAVAWLFTTIKAWSLARARDFFRHRRWMLRSFALTLAAVTLRIYLPLAFALGLPYGQFYPAIAFLCWVPNLIVIELAIRLNGGRTTGAALAASLQIPG